MVWKEAKVVSCHWPSMGQSSHVEGAAGMMLDNRGVENNGSHSWFDDGAALRELASLVIFTPSIGQLSPRADPEPPSRARLT